MKQTTRQWMKVIIFSLFTLHFSLFISSARAQRQFQHPGISYTQADLDRMRAMIAAKQEPCYCKPVQLLHS